MPYFEEDFLQFFIDLAPNNHKDWFDENRKRYHKSVKEPFKTFVERMIALVLEEEKHWGELEAKNCIFRINRDVRFSKDKTPYKMKVSAAIVDGGKKNHTTPGLYFELGPEDIRIYGGVYQLEKEQLLVVREAIADNLEEFKKAVNNPQFKAVYGEIHGDKNKIIPKHLKVAAEKEPLIFNKNWYYFAKFEPEKLLSEDFDKFVLDIYKAGNPVKSFFEKHLK